MSDKKENLDILLDTHVKAVMVHVDWQRLNKAVAARLDEVDGIKHGHASLLAMPPKYHIVYKIAASILIIAGVIFAIVAVRHGELESGIPHGHATLAVMPPSGRAVVMIDYGRDASAVVRTTSSEPAAICKVEIIDLEKYGYKYYKGAAYTIIVMPRQTRASVLP